MPDAGLSYLVLHSATVRNPRARWEFPKGGIEGTETSLEAATREFREETSLSDWRIREGYQRNLCYTYLRRGRKVVKTVTYYIAEVGDVASLARSAEHIEDSTGHWYRWGTFDEISKLLFHAKIRQLFLEADTWLRTGRLLSPEGVAGLSDVGGDDSRDQAGGHRTDWVEGTGIGADASS
jgi:8-oxo-dGTP pyrophosphatase MutT (NUDIX family)